MTDRVGLLLVEDSDSLASLYARYLDPLPVDVVRVDRGIDAQRAIERAMPGIMLLDLELPDMSGLDILRWVDRQAYPIRTVIVTAHGTAGNALEAMSLGAADFLEKPFGADRLRATVSNVLEQTRLQTLAEAAIDVERAGLGAMVGSSLAMQFVYRRIESLSGSDVPVLISGESGTGKELCARAVHDTSRRRDGPFVAVNCANIPRDLVESELFGHVKGAFTGATAARTGAARSADGGTLFLDELGELQPEVQAKLLRFVQSGAVQSLGSDRSDEVDVRIVCATNRRLEEEVRSGGFREDLFYRLNVVAIEMPPLRDRDDDVVVLADAFLAEFARDEGKRFTQFDAEVRSVFRDFDWPGNVRQLQNVVRNVVVLNDAEEVTRDLLPHPLNGEPGSTAPAAVAAEPAGSAPAPEGILPLWQVEKAAIIAAIDACGGNVPRAAALLEVSPSTLYRKRHLWQD